MPPLNQISKEEIEKFTENFGNRPIHHTSALGGYYQFPADEIRNSHLRLIDGMIDKIYHWKNKYSTSDPKTQEKGFGYSDGIDDVYLYLVSEKENIKNESNK